MKKFKVYQDKFDYLLCVPAILLLLAIFTYWILLYNEFVPFLLFYAASMVLIPLCIIAVMGLLLRKKIKKSILVFLPVVLTLFIIFTQGNNFITYSRHYIEFWIQKTIYVPEISRTQGSVEYKEWSIRSNTWAEYRIVYDPTDEVVKKNGTEHFLIAPNGVKEPVARYYIYQVGNHFYMLETKSEY